MNEAVPLKTLKTQPLNLPKNRDAFYGGKWHKPISGRSADAINPGTGDSLGPVADCGAVDIDAAVNAAKAAFPAWRPTTVLPVASGAPLLPAQNMNGWLNGMMRRAARAPRN
jgi:hypothetical protein